MRKAVLITALIFLAASSAPAAYGTSRFSAKLFFRGNRYGSDDGVLTGTYTAEGDSPSLFNTQAEMQYDFDSKLGMSINGAVCYSISSNFELDLAFGYTNISMDIMQRSNYERNAYAGGPRGYSTHKYANAAEYDFSIFNIRPGLNLLLSSGKRIVPYVGARIDIMIIGAEAQMIFAQPYVADVGGQSYLFIGEEARLDELRIEGSEVLVGAGIESGLEFKLARVFCLYAGVSLDMHFMKAFDDFPSMIVDGAMRARIEEIGTISEGMQFTSVGVILGLRYYF